MAGGNAARAAEMKARTVPASLGAAGLSLGVLAVIATGAVLQAARSVVIPLVVAWLLSYLLAPAVNFLVKRLRIPALLAVLAVVALLVALMWGAGVVAQQRLVSFVKNFPAYQGKISGVLDMYAQRLHVPMDWLEVNDWTRHLMGALLKFSKFFVGFVSYSVLVLVFLVFMLLARPYSDAKVRKAFEKSPERAETVIEVSRRISLQITRYLGTLFLVSLMTGLTVWGALEWMGVEFAFAWGLLAFVLNFIPTVGSIVASIPPVLMMLVQKAPDFWPAAGVAGVLFVIQQLFGNFVGTKLYGDRLNLSPVVILLFLLLWGWLWGIAGALLAVPIAAAIQITLEQIPALKPLAVLMGSGKRYASPGRKGRKQAVS